MGKLRKLISFADIPVQVTAVLCMLPVFSSMHATTTRLQTITVKNMTDRDITIQIIRPAQKPCQSIQETIAKRETRELPISNMCPLTQFKVLGSATNAETINQLTSGACTRFLVELDPNGDDILVTPFIAEDQGWYRKQEQTRERLEEKEREEQKSI